MRRVTLLLLASAGVMSGYSPVVATSCTGATQCTSFNLHRTDYAAIQFLYNQNVGAGLLNAGGNLWITPDSDPIGAINAALNTWSSVPTSAVKYAAPFITNLVNIPGDGRNTISFIDTPDNRSLLGGALAVTTSAFHGDGTFVDSDIVFSPQYVFSTTLAAGSYDFQGVLTHELGHSLGADHSSVLSSVMFQATGTQDSHQRSLTADDVAFESTAYPSLVGTGYGVISGVARLNGNPLRMGLVAVVDPSTGVTLSGVTSPADGSFSVSAPPGNYQVYIEPLGKEIQPGNLYSVGFSSVAVDSAFQTTFLGGIDSPTAVRVDSGSQSSISLDVTPGVSPLTVPYTSIGTAGELGESIRFNTGPKTVASGQSVDLVWAGAGIDPAADNNISVLGPAVIRPGSVRPDLGTVAGFQAYRVTLDIPALASDSAVTVIFRNGNDILTLTGLIYVSRPAAVNAGSYVGGAVAPGEILSLFGSNLGPASALANAGFDANGLLPSTLGNVQVVFDKTPSPLFFVSGGQLNLQVPYEVAGHSSTVMTVFYNNAAVKTFTLPVAAAAPGIFVVTNADGSVNGPLAPAKAGGVLVIYGTGAGQPSVPAGTGAPAPPGSLVPATVTIASKPAPPVYAGLTPGSVGLMQVNVAIPSGVAPGDAIPLVCSVNGVPAKTVEISVR